MCQAGLGPYPKEEQGGVFCLNLPENQGVPGAILHQGTQLCLSLAHHYTPVALWQPGTIT